MPIGWLFVLYFIVKSSDWKKSIIYLCFIFLLITSLPIVSTYIAKLFYSDNYKISNHNEKPAYVLIPTAGIYHDRYKKWHPTPESIIRTQYGKELSEQFSIPIILSGGEGKTKINAANLISEYFAYDFYLLDIKSKSTFQMAKNLKDLIEYSDGPILLTTNPLHHKRTILTLKKQDFDVLIPDNYIKNAQDDYSIIPSIRGFNSFNKIIYEFMGMAWYYLTGKI